MEQNLVRKERYRARSRGFLGDIHLKDKRKDGTYCKLLVDETLELSRALSDSDKDYIVLDFDAKLEETVTRLKRAQQEHPDEPDFATTEAHLWRGLKDDKKALNALRRATKAKPRGSSAWIRLASLLRSDEKLVEAIDTLREALKMFPNDKSIHLNLALLHVEAEESATEEAEHHFRNSFVVGDHNYDARFYYAEYLFWCGRPAESSEIFRDIDAKAPIQYRKRSPREDDVVTRNIGRAIGTVVSKRERFFFVRSGAYPGEVFCMGFELEDKSFDELEVGQSVSLRFRFNRKGPTGHHIRMA